MVEEMECLLLVPKGNKQPALDRVNEVAAPKHQHTADTNNTNTNIQTHTKKGHLASNGTYRRLWQR